MLAHTWRRNSGAVGISLCCCAFATSADLGDEPPTPQQIEAMAQAADNIDGIYPHEKYGPLTTVERWDLQYLATDESPYYIKDYDDERTGGNVLRGNRNEWEKK